MGSDGEEQGREMSDIFEEAGRIQEQAWAIISETGVRDHWESVGGTVNLVGSLKTGLLMNNRDIDLHVYTDPFKLSDSFLAISRLAQNPGITAIGYRNLIQEEDQCIEWHATYRDQDGFEWKMDMIHILPESPYAGFFEKVADRISAVLTQETREAILRIKKALRADEDVMSIQIYQAVIADGIRDLDGWRSWQERNSNPGIITWMP